MEEKISGWDQILMDAMAKAEAKGDLIEAAYIRVVLAEGNAFDTETYETGDISDIDALDFLDELELVQSMSVAEEGYGPAFVRICAVMQMIRILYAP